MNISILDNLLLENPVFKIIYEATAFMMDNGSVASAYYSDDNEESIMTLQWCANDNPDAVAISFCVSDVKRAVIINGEITISMGETIFYLNPLYLAPSLAVFARGGVVVEVRSTTPAVVRVIDYDDLTEDEGDYLSEINAIDYPFVCI